MIHVRRSVQRPTESMIKAFCSILSTTIHKALGRKGYIDCMIKPIVNCMRICGSAFTVQCAAGDNMMLHKAIECSRPGDILVVAVGGAFD